MQLQQQMNIIYS